MSNSHMSPTSWKDFLTPGEADAVWNLSVVDLDLADETPCRACGGRGYERRDPDDPCHVCHGEGVEL